MGCDIHLYVEKKHEKGWWITADTWIPSEWNKARNIHESLYDDRNYGMFAILADVRNYDGIIPISQPKGILSMGPDGLSNEVEHEYRIWDGDAHTPSWYTLKELLDFDWDKVASDSMWGIVNLEEYKAWDKKSAPKSYCRGVIGPNVHIITNEEMDKVTESGDSGLREKISSFDMILNRGEKSRPEEKPSYYTKVEWSATYKDIAGNFYTETIPKLKEIGSPENVRIVFFFDN